MINLSANISLLFKEYNFIERFEQAYKNDFKVVEFQFPYDFKPKILAPLSNASPAASS